MLISPDEINKSLASRGWKYSDKKISKSYTFDTYLQSIGSINKIAKLAEAQNHHPEIFIGYCNVNISLSSHDLGEISTKCVNLALGIDNILEA